jgi:HemY protein
LILAAALLGGAGAVGWHSHRLRMAARAALPPLPDLTGRPTLLVRLLTEAQARARSSDPDGVAELGRLYQANGYGAQAEACWRWLQARQPGEARWRYYLADLRRAAGDYDGMAVLLRQTVERAPGYAPAWLKLAEWEFKTGQVDAAAHDYGRRLALRPGDPYARLGLARVARHRGQTNEARRLIEELVQDDPDFPPGHNLYAEMLAAEGDQPGADRQRLLGRAAGRFREAADPWLAELDARCYDFGRLGILAAVQNETRRGDRGEAFLQRAVQLDPKNPSGYELLGALYLNLGDAAKARDTLERGLRQARTAAPSSLYYFHLSEAYRRLRQPQTALTVAQRGLTTAGAAIELYNALGMALGDLGRNEEAAAAFRQALARNPNDTNSNFNLAHTLLALGRREEASACLRRALVQKPAFPSALALLGRLELEDGRLDAAGIHLQRLYDSDPGAHQARQLLAQWHLRAGLAAEKKQDSAGAGRHYREGLELDPEQPELAIRLGISCLVQGRFDEAVAPLESFRRLQPNDPQGALYLGQAYARLGRTEDARRVLTEGVEIADRTGKPATAAHCRELLSRLPAER